ncbi:polysaccharide deacetylase family protein [Alsobacter soli]|nr:polysaccharide deacetylase family protein [Alsobacter soli]
MGRRAVNAWTAEPLEVFLTVDLEPDCPPYLWTWRGVTEGMPRLLDLFARAGIPVTFFTTGQTAALYPACIARLVADGHELACHGYSHRSFRTMGWREAQEEIASTNDILRRFASVTSFRAPYLAFPEDFLELLVGQGFTVDASRALYKPMEPPATCAGAPARLSASVTSSVLRLPAPVRDRWLGRLRSPVTLFVHPWEFVDLTRSPIRLDCRFRTGEPALACLGAVINLFKTRGAAFKLVREFAGQ